MRIRATGAPQEIDETILARDIVGAVAALRRRGARSIRAEWGWWAPASADRRSRGPSASIGHCRCEQVSGFSAVEGPAFIDAGAKGRLRPRDLLLIADRKELSQARNIRDDAHGRGVTTWMAPASGHGVALLSSADVKQKLLAWLHGRLG